MIAGEGIVGILLAVCAVIKFTNGKTVADYLNISGYLSLGNIGGLVFFALLLLTLLKVTIWNRKIRNEHQK